MSNIFKCYILGFRDNFYWGWIGNYQYVRWQVVLILSFWNLSGGNSQAAQLHQNLSSLPVIVSNSKSIDFVLFQNQKIQEIKLLEQFNQAPILIAAPENFNPGLRVPPPLPKPPVIKPPEKLSPPPTSKPEKPTKPVVLEGIQTNFRNDTDNFGQSNLFIEPTLQWRSPNGNKIFLTTGFDLFEQRGVESVINIPVKLGWQGKIGDATLHTTAGVDFFDRLPTAINFNAKFELPIVPPQVSSTGKLLSGVTISANVDHSPYKFNAQTLENQITAWRFGPDLYWQIDKYTSLFSSLRLGNYNDGNFEIQSFSRLERKLGQFSLAANLFNWSYSRNAEITNGYFSPSDFLVYNAEVAWEGEIADFLRCRLFATLGQQRLNGELDDAYGYGSRCTTKFSPILDAELDYSFSNVRNQSTGGGGYGSNSLTGQLRVKF
ncbi:hypothetical protein H6G80_18440 [Nostoc sp. FACHB-87]|uniref:hypothetical protein n=1 Tax=Nostocaceae TaxID=1162 RepID=UPI0016860CE8|nr:MULTISPECIES: hypothetical protein [Nostocaceae]MBD2456048.1 hypothetical protein [Nostoc sp. FACHB-87]MBD2476528.1 hypothetical protein [Anabaena sp. FACHB-83]